MSFIPMVTLALAVLLGALILRSARANIRGEYATVSSSVRLSEEDAAAHSPREMSRRDVSLLVGGMITLVILVFLSQHFWYMPASVPHQVLDQAFVQVPGFMEVTERREAASPLHWRVTLRGYSGTEAPSTPTHSFVYSVNRWTGAESTILHVGTGGISGTVVLLVFACVLGFGIYRGVTYLTARPCPYCTGRPFKLVDENTLIQPQLDLYGNTVPMVNEGHFHCDQCGFNQVQVYTGTRLSHGGSGPSEAPDLLDYGSRYVLDGGPRHQQRSGDDESWRERIERFKEQREREWMDGER